MAAVAGSATAMAAIMENDAAQEVFWNVQYSFGRGLATYANINNSTLIGLQSLSAVAASAVAMSAVAASATASRAVVSVISQYRNNIVAAISSSSLFSKKQLVIGSGSGTWESELNTNSIYIPVKCKDDGDTDYTVYSGVNTSILILSVSRHSGDTTVSSGVALRGAKVVGSGSSVGNVTFDVYTVN
jgi:hypothetical protein